MPQLPTRRPQRRRELLLRAVAAFVALGVAPVARSPSMAATGSSSSSPTPPDRYMRLVPESIGEWKRTVLKPPKRDREGHLPAQVEAEFTRGTQRAFMQVGASSAPPTLDAPIERQDDQGSEKAYSEGGAVVRETVRRIDGRAEVSLLRADGVAVIVRAHGVPAADLKQLALGVRASR